MENTHRSVANEASFLGIGLIYYSSFLTNKKITLASLRLAGFLVEALMLGNYYPGDVP
jgi:hypothetical protein